MTIYGIIAISLRIYKMYRTLSDLKITTNCIEFISKHTAQL